MLALGTGNQIMPVCLLPFAGTYIPKKEVEVVETIRATIIQPNQAIRLKARKETKVVMLDSKNWLYFFHIILGALWCHNQAVTFLLFVHLLITFSVLSRILSYVKTIHNPQSIHAYILCLSHKFKGFPEKRGIITSALFCTHHKKVDHLFNALVLRNFTYGLPVYGAVDSDLTVIKNFLDRCFKRK